jgi:hypothetical protein
MEIERFCSRMLLSSNRDSRARGKPGLVTVELAWIPVRGYDGMGPIAAVEPKHDLHDIFEGSFKWRVSKERHAWEILSRLESPISSLNKVARLRSTRFEPARSCGNDRR